MKMIGDRIKTAREALGMSQEELGQAVGVTRVTVSRWETNAIRPRGKLPKLAKALKKPVEWFQPQEVQQSNGVEAMNRIVTIERELELLKGQGSSHSIPPEVFSAWQNAPEQVQILCRFFLTKDRRYLKELKLSASNQKLLQSIFPTLGIGPKSRS